MRGKWHFILFLLLISYGSNNHWVLIGLLFLFFIFYHWFTNEELGKQIIFISIGLTIFCFSSFFPSELSPSISIEKSTEPSTYTGSILSNPEKSTTKMGFVFKQNNTKEKFYVQVYTNQSSQKVSNSIQHGAFCKISGSIRKPNGATNPGSFDYKQYLKAQGIHYQLNTDLTNITCSGRSILSYPYKLRENIIIYIKNKFDPNTFAWIQGLLFGNKEELSQELILTFQQWNLSHLLAISGLHVGLICGFMYFFLLRIIGLTTEKSKQIIMVFLPLYAILAGAQPPVLRAVFMAEFIFLFTFMKRKIPLTDIISITAIIFLTMNRDLLGQLGFQFSFLVTYSLILSKDILKKHASFFWGSMHVSFISQLVLIPLQLLHFYYISPLSLLANLVFVPYFCLFVIPLTLCAVLFSWLPIYFIKLFDFLLDIHQLLVQTILDVMEPFTILWVIGEISILCFIAYFITFLGLMNRLNKDKHNQAFLFGIILVLILQIEQVKPYFSDKGTITVLDVGQGDTIVIELPHRKGIIMIDAAEEVDFLSNDSDLEHIEENKVGRYVLRPFLWSKGIKHIDYLIITHPDYDHYGSMTYMINHFDVRNVYVNPSMVQLKPFSSITKINAIHQGMKLKIGEYDFRVLYPGQENKTKKSNDSSLVIYTELGGNRFLFTGDIGEAVEKELLKTYPNLKVDVLKVAHHGSKTSTSEDFLQATKPKHALISVGENNMYGHPSKDVVDRLENMGINLFRTDLNGAIFYYFQDTSGTFSTMIP
ncbi:competence protein ComEC [Salirhabdus euzebyi]|uniref:Competence protein ComEC n=1 Tax=Salirhabdus euzebyi TaxID=394506 RepID=A0A841Q715_9BACI|nr:DNA internalization-related competence protein ComEC/Rec2 [Salirhabdus euzebyi]MBB6454339.1 competence protein ComEC [Salirhabdus euzebyi]